jgi:hypothetical protein
MRMPVFCSIWWRWNSTVRGLRQRRSATAALVRSSPSRRSTSTSRWVKDIAAVEHHLKSTAHILQGEQAVTVSPPRLAHPANHRKARQPAGWDGGIATAQLLAQHVGVVEAQNPKPAREAEQLSCNESSRPRCSVVAAYVQDGVKRWLAALALLRPGCYCGGIGSGIFRRPSAGKGEPPKLD